MSDIQKFPVGIKRFQLPGDSILLNATMSKDYHSALKMVDLLSDGRQFT